MLAIYAIKTSMATIYGRNVGLGGDDNRCVSSWIGKINTSACSIGLISFFRGINAESFQFDIGILFLPASNTPVEYQDPRQKVISCREHVRRIFSKQTKAFRTLFEAKTTSITVGDDHQTIGDNELFQKYAIDAMMFIASSAKSQGTVFKWNSNQKYLFFGKWLMPETAIVWRQRGNASVNNAIWIISSSIKSSTRVH